MKQRIQQLEQILQKKIKKEHSLSNYTTYKIGGPAKYFFLAENNEDLVKAVTFSKKLKIPHFILAGGSNLLISDQGYNGLVIFNQAKDIIFKDDNRVVADAGVKLMDLVIQTTEKGLSGLENLAGIPGSVGGAIRGNAGAWGSEIADHIIGVEIMRGSEQFILDNLQCDFKYRDSIFKHNNDLIISAEFRLVKSLKVESKNIIKEILEKRKDGQPLECPSAGCVFKNILINSENQEQVNNINDLPVKFLEYKKIPTAWLIEQAGLKGEKIGDAQVSEKHANFIVNLDKATAKDVVELISEIKTKVKEKFDLELEEEIKYLD